jgi:hypothetical protein
MSATFDEVAHIGAGVRYLEGDLRLNVEHPPLAKVLGAIALPERDPPLGLRDGAISADTQWLFGSSWLHEAKQRPLELLARARLPLVLLNVWLIPCLALTARALFGPVGAAVAAGLAGLCPLWLAHATLVTTDAAASLFAFAAISSVLWLTRASSRRSQLLAASALAACVALALASKYSMLALPLILAVAGLCDALRCERRSCSEWRLMRSTCGERRSCSQRRLMRSTRGGGARCAASARLRSRELLAWTTGALVLGTALGVSCAWGLPPQLARYLEGVARVGANHLANHQFYAFGELFREQDPLYLARALLVKVPLPVWLFAGIGLALAARKRANAHAPAHPRHAQQTPPHVTVDMDGTAPVARKLPSAFVLFPVAYLLLMSLNAPALGVRYALPVLPFMLLLAAYGGAQLRQLRRGAALISLGLALQLGSFIVAVQNTPLSFFNGLFCFTGDHIPCLDDSNLDWGQALPDLARYREQHHPGAPLRVFYFGSSPIAAYVPNAIVANDEELLTPRPALYAISLHKLLRAAPDSWARRAAPSDIVSGVYAIYDLRNVPALLAR